MPPLRVDQRVTLLEKLGPAQAGSEGVVRYVDTRGRVTVEIVCDHEYNLLTLLLPPIRQSLFSPGGHCDAPSATTEATERALAAGDRVTLLEDFGPASPGCEGIVRYLDAQGRVTVEIVCDPTCSPLTILLPPSRASRFAVGGRCA